MAVCLFAFFAFHLFWFLALSLVCWVKKVISVISLVVSPVSRHRHQHCRDLCHWITHTNTHTQTEYYSSVLVLTLNQSTELICWWPPSIMHHSRCHFEKRAIECSLFLANALKWLTLVDVVQKKKKKYTQTGHLMVLNTVEEKVVTNRKKATTESESATLAQKSNWSINLCHVAPWTSDDQNWNEWTVQHCRLSFLSSGQFCSFVFWTVCPCWTIVP